MPKSRRTYAGAAVSTTITAGINSTDTSITLSAATGWAAGPFYVVIDPGTSSEEKVYVSSRSGTSLTVGTRGVDGTTAKSHTSGAVIYPVHTAIDSDEANELTAKYTTRGDIVYQGNSTFERLGVGSADSVLKSNGTDPSWGQVGTNGIADDAITAAKIATGAVGATEIADGSVGTSELANDSVTAAKIATGAVGADEIATGAVGTDELADSAVTSAKIADGTIVNADINASAAIAYSKLALSNSIVAGDITSNAVTTAKILDANVTNAKLDYATVPQMTVSTSDPSGGKNGDIWVKVV